MASSSFDVFLNAQLAVLHDRLVAEHRQHVSRLQNQVVDLMAENSVLCRSVNASPRESGATATDPSLKGAVGDVLEEGDEEGDESEETNDSPKPSVSKQADANKKPDESIPGTVSEVTSDSEEVLPESVVTSHISKDSTLRDRALGGGNGEVRAPPPLAWGTQAQGNSQPAPSGAPPVLPPLGQPQELVVRPGRMSTLQSAGPRQSTLVGPTSTLQPHSEDEPQPMVKTLSGSRQQIAKDRRTSTMTGSNSEPDRRTSVLKGSGNSRSSIAGHSGRPPRMSQRVSILGHHHPDAETSTKNLNDAKEQAAMSTKGFGCADNKRISFQAGTAANPLHKAHDPQDEGFTTEGRNNQSVIGELGGFREAKEAKRHGGGGHCPTSGIDRLSPLKRHSAVDTDLSGLRRGSNLGGGGLPNLANGRRQSLALEGRRQSLALEGRRQSLALDGRRQSLALDGRRQSNLAPPGEYQRARADSTMSMVSMFGGNNLRSSYEDVDDSPRNGGGFRPSRQRISVSGEEGRLSRVRGMQGDGEGGLVKFEVAQAWVLGKFGNSMRRSSMGGAARMSQFMDHFLDKDEKEQESAERRDGSSNTCNRYLQHLVIHPNSGTHVTWDFFGLILIAYDAVMVPLEIFQPPKDMFSTLMDWVIRLFWTLNILVTFCTGILRDDGVVEMRPRRIARHYILTWLPLDVFLSVFDWIDLVFQGIASEGLQRFGASWLRALRMVRSARLIRLLRAPEIAKKITELIPFHEWLGLFATVIKIMLIFLWIAHAVACIWFGVGRYMCGHGRCWIDEGRLARTSWGVQYAISLHWSLSALSGDTSVTDPENIFERVYAMMILYLAFVISASYVGSITTTMTNIHMMASEQSSKLSILRRFLLDHGISRTLAVRVQRNAQHAMIEHKSRAPESSVELLGMISQPLLVEVHYEIYSRGIMVHPFFHCYERVNPAGIRKICHTAITMLSLHTKDVLFSDLEVAEKPRTFFLVSGKLQYMHDMKVSPVLESQWMCEHALWTVWTHCGTTRATTETRLLCLDAEKWQETVCTFPTDHACVYAAEFVNWLNADPERARTDMGPPEADITSMLLQAFPAEDDEDFDDDEDDRPRSREGSFISAIPGVNALTTLMAETTTPNSSARVPSSRQTNSVIAGIMNVMSPMLLGEKKQSFHKSRVSAHQLAAEKHKSCQRRSSIDAAARNSPSGVVSIPVQVMHNVSITSAGAVSRLARCKLFMSRCCAWLVGRRDSDDMHTPGASASPEPQDDHDSESRSNESVGKDSNSEPEATFDAQGTVRSEI